MAEPDTITLRRTYRFRLDVTPAQAERLEWTLRRCCRLYNELLAERRDCYRWFGVSLSRNDQINRLPAFKQEHPEYLQIGSQVLQDVAKRVDRTFAGFFRRVREGSEKPGFPRFRPHQRYDSFTYGPSAGWKLDNYALVLTGIGALDVRWSRAVQGTVKEVTISRDVDQWYVEFSCALTLPTPVPSSLPATGIDRNVKELATCADGTVLPNVRCAKRSADTLARQQQVLARRQGGKGKPSSRRRKKQRVLVAKVHRNVRRQRTDHLHKMANRVIARFGTIYLEDLRITNLTKRVTPKLDAEQTAEEGKPVYLPNGQRAKSGLNRAILDVGWRQFACFLAHKAAWAGARVGYVPAAYTTQTCSRCGRRAPRPLTLADRWFECVYCGLSKDRDENAACTILRAGLARQSTA